MSLGDEKYLSFTTFKRDGTPVSTPVWAVPLADNKVGFWTSSKTGKAKRLRNNPKVSVQPSNARGQVKSGTEPVEATAEVVTGPVLEQEIRPKVKAKYGLMVHITHLLARIGHIGKGEFPYADRGVVITLD